MACSNHKGEVNFFFFIVIIFNNYIFNRIYFDYKCYYEVKDYYEKPYETDTPKEFFQEYNIREKYKSIFKIPNTFIHTLIKYLIYDRYSYSNGPIRCKYINYWLNEQIQKLYIYDITESNFYILKDIADDFARFRSGLKSYQANTCSTFFSYLPFHKYTTMHTLYDTYGLYHQINKKKNNLSLDNICNNFFLINHYYNSLLRDNKDDEDLYNNLNNFRGIVQEEMKKYKGKCSSDLSHLMPLKEFTRPPPKITDSGEGNSGLSLESKTALDKELKAKPEESDPEPKPELQREERELGVEKAQAPAPASHNSDTSHQIEVLSQKEGHQEEIPVKDHKEEIFPSVDLTNERRLTESSVQIDGMVYQQHGAVLSTSSPDGIKYQPYGTHVSATSPYGKEYQPRGDQVSASSPYGMEYQEHGDQVSASSPDGILQRINGAFSSISEYVEPVPLMGVSGGMGALYLLLRVL
ncbi:hypothetical protein PVNG_05669 [Plasmodium vivax North Korean]|uniref:VIR protein n=1 Tax=Plasmodium vivax North Korean TaxID=1035514 RepID=A0A0J9TVU8_PLAVI|nr:hypothetical protein PVNG_05669 [Plasmodium vivax North Korean]